MGLDWCILPKIISGKEEEHAKLTRQIKELDVEITGNWNKYLEDNKLTCPSYWPNEIFDTFKKTEAVSGFIESLREAEESKKACEIDPYETLGAPRAGDPETLGWLKSHYEDKDQEFRDSISFDEYMEKVRGEYIVELAPHQDGIGKYQGFAVGSTSFRGNMLGRVWFIDEDVKGRAYVDHSAEELVEYADILQDALNYAKTESSEPLDDNQVDIIESAIAWCRFWGERGHRMHAWF